MTMVNNVNHKNMIVMWLFLKGFAKEKCLQEKDISIFDMLKLQRKVLAMDLAGTGLDSRPFFSR